MLETSCIKRTTRLDPRGAAVAEPARSLPDDAVPEAAGRRAAHVRDTRRALLDTARQLFAENGFGGTKTEDLVQRAGLTRGALYHHFRDKEDLFRAVHDEVADEVVQLLWRRSGEHDVSAWELFRINSEVYLDAASTNAAYRQIVLVDGPAVLGWRSWSERTDGPTQQIARYLTDAVTEGVLEPQPVEQLAHLLAAVGAGSAMYVAHAADPAAARREISRCNEQLLSGLGVHDDATERPLRTLGSAAPLPSVPPARTDAPQ
jgi:AcrR family transcriptional regulator